MSKPKKQIPAWQFSPEVLAVLGVPQQTFLAYTKGEARAALKKVARLKKRLPVGVRCERVTRDTSEVA